MNKLRLCVLALAAASTAAQAAAADLLDTYRAAREQDAVIAAARATQRAGQEKLPQGRALLMPNVSLTANSTFNDSSIQYRSAGGAFPFRSGDNRYNNHGYGVALVQPLFNQPKWATYSEAKLQVAQSDSQFRSAEQDLITRVAQAYFDVLIAQDSVRLAGVQKAAITEQLEQAKRNFEVGTATITDTHEAQARYDLVSAQEIAAQSNLEISKRALQQLTNAPASDLLPLVQPFRFDQQSLSSMDKWVEDSQQHNLQIAIVQAALDLAEQEVKRNHAGHYPTVDLVANYSENYASGSVQGIGSDTRAVAVGVQLNLPLYQGGAIQSKQREAEAIRDRAREDMENVRRTVALQTRQAYVGVVNGMAQVKALQQALKSSESLLESSKLGQQVGVRTNLDVLNAQQQLFSTQRDLFQAEYNYLVSQLRLKAAAGMLREEDLVAVNRAFH